MADGSKSGRRLSRADLDRLIRGLGKKPKGPQGIPRQPREQSASGDVRFPASFAQRRLWLVDRLTPGRATYNLAGAIVLCPAAKGEGSTDGVEPGLPTQTIRNALGRLLGRHEVLRTHFVADDGEPWQVIIDPDSTRFELPEIDLRCRNPVASGADSVLDRHLSSEARRPFDLARGPLLRAVLWHVAGDRKILQLTLHHTIADGWSLGLLLRELGSLLVGKPLDPLPIQVADHSVWQRRRLDEGKHAASLDALKQQLAGVEPLELPTDRRRPSEASGRGRQIPFTLEGPVAERLRDLARERGTTLFAVLAAALGAFLARHTPSTDLTIGFPVAGRRRRELEALVGFFVNTLVLRLELEGDPTVAELITRADSAVRRAEEHQEVPFEQVVEALAPERSTGRAPLFQVMLAYEAAGLEPIQVGDIELRPRELWTGTSKFDLGLTLRETTVSGGPAPLEGWWETDADLFDQATVETLADRFARLVEGLAQGSDGAGESSRLSSLPLLDGAEIHQLTREWNGSPQPFPSEVTIPGRIAAVAAADPGALALVFEEPGQERGKASRVELTYGELVARSRRLAAVLRSHGVGRGARVGVCLERSPELVVALLAVLEAGAAYLPLDLAYPAERLTFMLEDGGASVLLAHRSLADRLPTVSGVETLWVDTLGADAVESDDTSSSPDPIASEPPTPEPPIPQDLAYVIYTSGSTGRPKGVQMPHRSVARLMSATEPWFDFGRDDVWTFFHSHAFDFSVWEIWGCLMTGGRLVVVPYLTSRSPEAMANLLRDERVTVLNQTPSAFRQLTTVVAQAPPGREPQHLRRVIFGGEALEPATLGPWFERFGDQQPLLVNMYGITETTVHVTYRPLSAAGDGAEDGPSSPLGEVIPDQTLRLLDRHGGVAPRGVVGEIHVGGAGLAWGYLGRPGLTAQRFVPDPWGPPGSRQYRSGDLARYVASGDLDFLGRIDHQVKVRGFRIELGEIEAALLDGSSPDKPSLSEAVVLAQGRGGETRLVAYVVPAPDAEALTPHALTPQALRESLGRRLPDYMVPSALVFLEALPLTANGKLDRDALSRIDLGGLDSGTTGGPPRNPTEEVLVRIFESLLEVEGLGIDADFFQLGGHSLLATRLLARVRDELGVELPLKAVFDTPTVAELALQLEVRSETESPRIEPLGPTPADEIAPLTFAQERLWFLHQLAPDDPSYHVGLELDFVGRLDLPALETALATVRSRHEVLRCHFPAVEGEPIVEVESQTGMTLPVVDFAAISEGHREATAARWAAHEVRRPFDLGTGPLLRGLLLDLGSGDSGPRHRLVLTLHHIVSDGWSLGILLGELAEVYTAGVSEVAVSEVAISEAAVSERPREEPRVSLPELEVQVSDFASWQRRILADESLREPSLAYWNETLAEVPVLTLPTDRPRRTRARRRGVWRPVRLAPTLVASLRRVSSEQGGTLFTGLLAGFWGLLARLSGQGDFALGTTLASRRDLALEPLIGDFVDTVALRFSRVTSFETLLEATRERLFEADAHRLVPFERVLEALDLERDLSMSPVFQAMLVLLNTPSTSRALPEVELAVRPLSTGTAKFDLTLSLAEDGGDYDASELASEGLPGVLEYDRDLFDATTIERWWQAFETLVGAAATSPDRSLWELPLLRPSELHELIHERAWGPSAPVPDSLPEVLASRLAAEGDAPALVMAGDPLATLSFAELGSQAASLAAHLHAIGVGPESVVALLMERSPSLVVSALAVWWAGGAYVPLDLEHPESRQSFQLEDSGARWLIGSGERAERLAALVDGLVLVDLLGLRLSPHPPSPPLPPSGEGGAREESFEITKDKSEVAGVGLGGARERKRSVPRVGNPAQAKSHALQETSAGQAGPVGVGEQAEPRPTPATPQDPNALAYVLYTSGSTGRPKGVEVTHGGLARYVDWAKGAYRADEGTGTLVHSPLGFDLTVTGLWVPLAAGRPVTLISETEGVEGLERALRKGQDRTLIKLTPSHLEVLRHRVPPEELAGRARALVIGGEALHAETLAPWLEHAPETRLINEYGPTETVVGCCIEIVETQASEHRAQRNSAGDTKVDGSRDGVVPIGRPITGTGLWVVDRALRPVPPGSVGELVIGGEGVARGYRGRPGLTAERFVPDPFSGRPGARLYTSGDRVRSLADGRLTYLGRTDHQVKIRGHRIEPGEIEAAALALPGVEEAVVVARPHATGPRLVAYATGPVTPEMVESGLREALPAAWVPSAVLVLDELPRLPNGKFDRRHLPEPSWSATEAGQAPRTSLEAELLELWVSLLELDDEAAETAGVDSDFFRLGGHSLLATRLLARVRDRWGVEVTLRELFEAPTVASLASWVEQRQESDEATFALPGLEARPEGTPGAPTFAQERLWFLHRLDPDDPTYHVGIRIDLRGQVDLRVLARSLDTVVSRHDVLRSHFPEVGGELTLAIDPPARLPLPVVDLRDLPREHATTEAERRIAAEVRQPFDLGRGPLIRALWIDLGTTDGRPEGRLILTLHHTVSDGWSLGILLGELATVYATTLAGGQAKLPTLPVQVADYALWQRQLMEDASRREPSLDYWRESLGDVPTLALPSDRPRRARSPRRGGWRAVQVSPDLANGLRQLAAEHGTTLFAVLLAGFWGLLSRLSTQRDFALGTTLATRRDVALEGLIGDFVDTLALRIAADGSEDFADLLERAQDRLLDGESHRWVPFEQILSELDVERDLGSSPVFQAILVLLNTPTQSLDLPGCELTVRPLSTGTAKFDLTLSLAEDGGSYDVPGAWSGGLLGILEYDRDLFDPTTVERWWRGFETLLRGVLDQPGQPLGALPLLSAGERHQLVWEWNASRTEFPAEATIPARIKAVAQSRRDAIAVVGEGLAGERVELTYGELLVRSRRVADHLRRLGVGRGTLVGVCLERSVDLVVTLLGVLESGAAYLPIDLAYPEERLAFMLEDGAAPVLLSQRSLADRLPEVAGVETVWIDGFDEDGAGEAPRSPAEPPHPSDLAYVIYTSGSTGRPKGVLIPHQNVARLLSATQPWFDFGADDVWTFFHSHAFDFSVWEIWACLATGGRLVVVPYWQSRSPEALATLLRNEGVTILNQTPSAFRQLMTVMVSEAVGEDGPLALRRVIFGGEALEPATLAPWFDRFGDTQPLLVNMFGITETTVHVTYRPLSSESGAAVGSPVGTVIPDQTVRLLDRRGLPAPLGVAGEIHVGGAGLAWGYLGRPGLTAERFVPDPWGTPGGRQYRSGDLGRYLASGELDFLGRIDHQVKVRGFRIELGEIEAALLAHPAVSEAVVLAEGSGDETRLVAYAVGAPGEEAPTVSSLRESLGAGLPEYMVPSAFALLDALPLTANGKLDRGALSKVELGREASVGTGEAPRTPMETLLVKLFEEVLGVEGLGVEANFFQLGGHSLSATRLVSRLRDQRVDVPLRLVFEAPTVEALAGHLEAREVEAVDFEMQPAASLDPAGPSLTFAQERLWFLHRLAPEDPSYNIGLRLDLEGRLEPSALQSALASVVERHEILRASFPESNGRPTLRVAATGAVSLPRVDLSSLPLGKARHEAERLAGEQVRAPYDLAMGPLLRFLLFELPARSDGNPRHRMLLMLHHTVADGGSLGILLSEMATFYSGLVSGVPARPPEPPRQISEVAAWQHQMLSDTRRRTAAFDYWRQTLDGVPVTALPTDRPRRQRAPRRGALRRIHLPKDTVSGLRQVSRTVGGTFFTGILATLGALLARLSIQEDLAIGTAMATRRRSDFEGVIGDFVETLALRLAPRGARTFHDLLEEARNRLLDAESHHQVPFEQVLPALDLDRDLAVSPVFQVMLVLHESPTSTVELPGLDLSVRPLSTGTAKFDLTLSLGGQLDETSDDSKALAGVLEYDRDLFDATTIQRWWHGFETLLEAALADPDRPLGALPLLAPGEQHQLVWEWNASPTNFPAEATIPAQIKAVAQSRGDAIAVVGESLTGDRIELTYGELQARSRRVADHLRRLGVGRGTLVGVCLERSVDLVVTLLGVLESGAAYLPIDLAYPAERLAFMLEDGGAPVLLSQRSLSDRLPEVAGVETVWIDELDQDAGEDAQSPAEPPHPSDLAYVIYTSGSTGRPKGVLIPHQNVARLLSATEPWFDFGPDDVWTFFHSHAFDFSVWEIWACLATGGRLVVVPYWQSRSPEALATLLRSEGVTILNQTPSAFRQLMTVMVSEAAGEEGPLALRRVIFGGEALEPATLAPWFERFGDTQPLLVNMFGITETTVHVTYRPLSSESATAVGSPVGTVIPDQTVRLLDRRGLPAPLGVAGEIHVGGAGLAWGYLGRPGLTAERFVPDPWGTPGGRQYRSGDLGRYLASGELDFLGRIDHQVKVRGFRIELGEIESALLAHPAVSEAVVLAEGSGDDTRLVAYTVVAPGVEAPTVSSLRESLGAGLPEYMVPSAFALLDALPLTANGKLDRRALSKVELGGETPAGTGGAPQTAAEALLVDLFEEILGVEGLGVGADFFQLGGHSLLATRLVSRLRDEQALEVPLRTVFEAPTVEALARHVETLGAQLESPATEGAQTPPTAPSRSAAERSPIPSLGTSEAPLSFAQERLWFLEQLAPGSLYNLSGGLRFRGPLDRGALTTAFAALIHRHAVLRTVFRSTTAETQRPNDPAGAVQVVRASEPSEQPPLVWVDLRVLPEASREATGLRLARALLARPFDLATGPLLRACLVEGGEDDHTLFVVLHHVVTDGWSQGILLAELAEFYNRALETNDALPVADLPVQYTDYASWQRGWLRGEVEEEQLDWWRRTLDAVPRLELPTDRPRPAVRRQRGRLVSGALGADLGRGLKTLAQSQGASLFMVLLTGFQVLAWRLTGQTDLAVGTPVAGRQRTELEGLIGFFVNTLVLRSEVDPDQRFGDALAAVRDHCLDAWAHQDLPFERLVAELAPERDLSQTPLFQVLVTLQDGVETAPDFTALEVEPRGVEAETEAQTAKFDLSLVFSERRDGGLDWVVEADRDLFDATTLHRWLGSLERLMQGALDHPERSFAELPIQGRAERHQLLVEWNAFGTAPTSESNETAGPAAVIDGVWRRAAEVPEALAVAMADDRLDFGGLIASADALAVELRTIEGLGPDTVVAVCVERSLAMVVAVVAIQRSGAAYLPLDPHLPDDRLHYMVRDSGSLALVASASQRGRFEGLAAEGLPILDPGASQAVTDASLEPSDGAPMVQDPRQLAYLIYTSGSTGRPKGVGISHGTLRQLVDWHNRAYGLGPGSRTTQLAGPAFDASVWEIWPALAAGASLHLPDDEVRADAVHLVDWMRREGIEVAFLPTPLAEAALTSNETRWGDSLRWLLTGGDRLRQRPDARLPFQLVNHYGPTENTVVATCGPVESSGGPNPDIGRPLPAVSVQVLGPDLRPQPLGGVGEVVLGAEPGGIESLARGYHRRPGLTAAAFVPDPSSSLPGARLYRTGDLGRWTPEGRLDFLGRRDHQVKVRGFRIELGEIEAELLALPAVAEAVVLARGDGESSRLVAFVVAAESIGPPTPQTVREALASQLPEYMVPSAVLWLDALPLTANGKLDRAALARIEVEETLGELYVAPRTPLEARVAEVFAEVLDRDRVGVDDDFFALGGHSLLATRVVARLRQALGVDVVLRQLFEAPTVARLSAALDRSHLAMLETIPRRSLDRAALSPGQERLWFLDQLDPGRATYNIPLRLAIEGELDRGRLAAALVALAQRHEVLRTTYETEGEHPVQVVQALDPDNPLLPMVDLSALPESRRRAEVDRLAEVEARTPFDLARGPVWRTLLLAESASRHTLVLTFHHIAADGASIPVVLREVAAIYRGEPLEPLAIQISDHAVWQRQWLEGEGAEASLDWWREHLAEVPSLELPFDRPRPAVARQRGRSIPVALSAESVTALEARCREQGATLFQGLLAVFGVALARVTHQGELAVGTPMANRPRVELEGLVGFLVNTLALRVSVGAGAEGARDRKGFQGLLDRVREELLAVSAHEGVPFERVVQAVDPERDLSAPPLFQAFLAFQDLAGSTESFGALGPGVSWHPSSISTGVAKFDLSLALQRDAEGVRGELELDRDLFDRTTGERLARRIGTVLDAVLASPERDLWDLEVLAPAERHQLVWEQAGPWVAPSQDTLVDRIGAVARQKPERIAILGEDGSEWSYGALWSASCALAVELWDLLRETGGGEPIVGLCLDRSPELVVGMLAAQLAGAAYAPLDPTYPRERLGFILDDTSAPVIVTREGLEDRLPESSAVRVLMEQIPLDPHFPKGEVGDPRSHNPDSGPPLRRRGARGDFPPATRHPDALAYLIYTSGSTGRPKGVAISHRSALALIDGLTPVFPDSDLEGVLAATSINFDLSIFELFGTLVRGGTVVLAQDALALPEHPARDRVRLINTVPSAMAELVRGGWLPPELSTVNLAGEPLRRALVDGIHGVSPGARVLNLYGPSEDTTYSTWVLSQRGLAAEPTIGRPVAGTVAHVVDPRGRPVPLGSDGELVLGGLGLARGYLGRPSLTARSFVPDGLGSTPGDRLYRTGDRVRRRGDGELVFLGRFDHQVKVRGYRIELGEIEVALLAQPAVSDVVVLVLGDGSAARLVGCVEGVDATGGLDPEGLREALSSKLPAPLVPSGWLVLEALPRLPNGKVDRKKLRRQAEHSVGGVATVEYVAPRSPLEATVAEIFADVLDQERVGIEDDFFALGGHSLLATRVVARLRGATGLEIPLRQLFEAPTVARLAAVLGGASGEVRKAVGGPIERLATDPEHFALSFSQERLWILDRLEPGNAAYNMPYSLRLRGNLDAEVLVASLAALLARHQGLRTRFDQVAGRPIQVVEPRVELPLLRIDLERLDPGRGSREIARLTRRVTLAPIDLTHSPLLRCALVRRSADDHVLMLSVHHAVADGWSLGILTRELGAFYEAGVTSRQTTEAAAGLTPIPLRYVDFADWQRRWLVGDELERQLSYWRDQLEGMPPVLDLPTDQGRPAIRDFRGGSARLDLGLPLSRAVRSLSQRQGATVFMTLLAAFQVVLGRLAGQQQFAIGTPVAGRNRTETEDLVGMFLNTLVLRADLEGDPTFVEFLDRVRGVTLGAYDHQDVPFEKLLDTLTLERDLSRTPLFQVFFNLLNLPLGPLHLSALEIEPLELGDLRSKFDLTVYAHDPGPEPGGEENPITFEWVYNANLFSAPRVEAMISQFRAALEQAVAEPERRLSEIDLRTRAMTRLLPDPTQELDGSWQGPVHRWMAERAAERPEAPAVESPEGSWTYGELAATSHRLAHRLVAAGLERGDSVALVAHRSASLVWSVFGTLAAGGAFVLLDPAYPAERLVRILERARPRVILRLVAAGPLGDEVDAFVEELAPLADLVIPPWSELATSGEGWAEWPTTPPEIEIGPEDAAAIGFTSGSTGLPKGIVGRHGPLTHFLPWQCERFDLGSEDRYSLLSGLAHDPIQRDLFTSMATGATLCLPEPDELLSAGYLARWLGEARVSVAHLTPAMAQVVSAGGGAASLPDLRRVFLTGDVLSVRDVERLERLAPGVRCVNFYGSTETQRAVGYREADLAAEPGRKKEILALGRGMEDVQLLVAGPTGALAGIGELGEIWVRSPHLARGYLGDPAETAARFRVNPFGARNGDDRVYRTGDLGRYRPDGDVEFAGRADQQVKIRGFRIELGEIVGCLVRQPSVVDAAVVLDTGSAGRQLVACVVPAAGQVADPDTLRAVVRAELPDYMVPSRWLSLEALPITPNGKLDRRALARAIKNVGEAPAASGAAEQAPRTQLERLVASTLSDLLGGVAVGLGDNFFDLGGNSLLLVELHGRLRTALDRDFPAVEIFQHPTAGTLANYLAGLEGAAEAAPVEDRREQLKTGRDRLRQRRRRLTGRSGR